MGHSVLTVDQGSKAIICFDDYRNIINAERNCELFDGSTTETTFATNKTHENGALALYNGQPTAVGGRPFAEGSVETLTENGWIPLKSHPR